MLLRDPVSLSQQRQPGLEPAQCLKAGQGLLLCAQISDGVEISCGLVQQSGSMLAVTEGFSDARALRVYWHYLSNVAVRGQFRSAKQLA